MKQYIGLIRYPDGSVADNTTVNCLQKVWRNCCCRTSAYIGGCDIYEAKFDDDGNIIGECIYGFADIDECRECYEQKFGRPYNKGQEHLKH